MMLKRLIFVTGVEHAMLNIGVNLCLLVLLEDQRVRGAARESNNERTTQEFSEALHLFT